MYQQLETHKKSEFHNKIIIPYLAKHGIYTSKIVFIFNSGDEYMRRAFIRRGWIENLILQSHLYDLRWDMTDNNVILINYTVAG